MSLSSPHTILRAMYRIDVTSASAIALGKVAGLRDRVEETLKGILETAAEIRLLHNDRLLLENATFMRVHVANHVISYTLDLNAQLATVLLVEPIRKGNGNDESSAA